MGLQLLGLDSTFNYGLRCRADIALYAYLCFDKFDNISKIITLYKQFYLKVSINEDVVYKYIQYLHFKSQIYEPNG